VLHIRRMVQHGWYSDSLRAGRSGDRIPVGTRLSAHVHTGPGAHPSSYTNGTGSFPGVKLSGLGVDHNPPPPSAKVKDRVNIHLNSPSGPSWPVLGRILHLFVFARPGARHIFRQL